MVLSMRAAAGQVCVVSVWCLCGVEYAQFSGFNSVVTYPRLSVEAEIAALQTEAEEDARLTKQLAEQDAAAIERLAALKVCPLVNVTPSRVAEPERERFRCTRQLRQILLASMCKSPNRLWRSCHSTTCGCHTF